MRLLRINDTDIDIDDQTAIGVDLQSYDIKSLGDTFVKVTNTFTVPATINNLVVFGLPNNPQSLSTKVYDESVCNYWVGNDHIVDNGKVSVQEIQDRISLFVYEKPSIWDILKTVYFSDILPDLITWLGANKGLYTGPGTHFVGTFLAFINQFINPTEGVILPMAWSNLRERKITVGAGGLVEIERFITTQYNIYLRNKYVDTFENSKVIDSYGGHFCIYVKTIFEFIEDTYGVNFLTGGGVLPGNIWDDPIAKRMYTDVKEVAINVTFSGLYDIYFFAAQTQPTTANNFEPYVEIKDKADKSLYDFVLSFMQHFNIIKDEFIIEGEKVIRLARFDDLETIGSVKDFSGLAGIPKYKPFVDGYAQNNYIKFKEVYDTGDSNINSKVLALNNKNIDKVKTLFEIDAHVPAVIKQGVDSILDLSKKEAFKTFTFMVSNGLCSYDTFVTYYIAGVVTGAGVAVRLQKAQLYSLDSEYNFLAGALVYPKWYEVQKWLTPPQVKNFEFFKLYYFRELNGSFFINKIKGYNPELSNESVTLEILRMSDRTPVTPPDLDYWVDGVDDSWFDGVFDYWY